MKRSRPRRACAYARGGVADKHIDPNPSHPHPHTRPPPSHAASGLGDHRERQQRRRDRRSVRRVAEDAGLFADAHTDIPADLDLRAAIPARMAARRAGTTSRVARRAVPGLSGTGCGQDAPSAGARQGLASTRRGLAGGGAVPDNAADTPVGHGGGGARRAARTRRDRSSPTTRLPWRGGHLRAHRQRPAHVGGGGRKGHVGGRR